MMSSDESFNEVQEKLMTLNLLRITFEKFRNLDHLRQYFLKHDVEVSLANFSRYINGKAIPKSKLKNQLLRVLLEEESGVNMKELIISGIESWSDESGIVKINNTQLLTNLKKLQAILFLAIQNQIIPKQVDKIISLEGNSVHMASVLAHLLNVNYVNAREKKPIGTKESYVEDISTSIGILNTIYLPIDFIEANERIILVDDIIRTGTSMKALLNLVRKSGGNPVQIIILTGIGSKWESVREFDSIPFKSLTVIP